MPLSDCWIVRWRSAEIPSESLGESHCDCYPWRCRAQCETPSGSHGVSPVLACASGGEGGSRGLQGWARASELGRGDARLPGAITESTAGLSGAGCTPDADYRPSAEPAL